MSSEQQFKAKPRPNHQLYLAVLRKMTPEQRLLKAFELTEFSRQLFLHGLRHRFPEKSEAEIKKVYLEGLAKCHNRNY
ncbi:MAG: hypothetical protein HYX92_11860 [Chloroflexi bacterium]|nr:hypothetical protein [Chloroflexota bacterium]